MKFLSLLDCLFIHQSMYAYVSIYFSSSILNIIMPVVLKRKCLTVFYLGHRKEYVCFDQVFEIGASKVDLKKYFYFVKSFSWGDCSGLDKDLDQWVFHTLLFNLMSILLYI